MVLVFVLYSLIWLVMVSFMVLDTFRLSRQLKLSRRIIDLQEKEISLLHEEMAIYEKSLNRKENKDSLDRLLLKKEFEDGVDNA